MREDGFGCRAPVALAVCHAALLALALTFTGCGDATCPAGSKSVDGECVPDVKCGEGLKRVGDTCELASGVTGDAGGKEGDGAVTGQHPSPDAGTKKVDAGAERADAAPVDAGTVPEITPDAMEPMPDAATPPEPDLCADYACGDHGHCEVVGDEPRCACADSFTGARCEQCEFGKGLSGQSCVPVCEADAAPDCGPHGACDATDGVAKCVCEHPAFGTLCDGCAQGFAQQNDGTCKPDCGDCGAHGFCDGTLHVPACGCYPGYAQQEHVCRWVGDGTTGGIRNGDLSSVDGWETNGVEIAGGAATFMQAGTGAMCDLGVLSQTCTMPTREQAEQFMLEIGTSTTCTSADAEACPPLLVEIGDAVTRVRVPGGAGGPKSATQRLCLGDVGYGGEITLRVRPGVARVIGTTQLQSAGFPCNTAWPTITGVAIRPATADECPKVGVLPNSGFDNADSWSRSTGATIHDGLLDLQSSAVARVNVIAPTQSARPGAALQLVLRADSDPGAVEVDIDGMPLSIVHASTTETRYVCLPDWALGTAHEIALRAFSPEMLIESALIVSESRCGSGAFDSGFERALETGGWFVSPLGNSLVDIVTDSRVHEGNSSLRVRSTILTGLVRFPGGSAGGHAAVSFAARCGAADQRATLHIVGVSPALDATSNPTGVSWSVTPLCAGRIWDGQLAQINVTANAGFIDSGSSGTPEALLDEFGAAVSPFCQ